MKYISTQDLTIIGASIYLCEGAKARTDNRVWKHFDIEFTNTDSRLVAIF